MTSYRDDLTCMLILNMRASGRPVRRSQVIMSLTLLTISITGGIFKNFFPTKPKTGEVVVVESDDPQKSKIANMTNKKSSRHVIPLLEEEELNQLAEEFAAQIPENELSVRVRLPSLRLVDVFAGSLCSR